MGWKTLDDMALMGKTVLLRVDINVPVKDGLVTDATRIARIIPTINAIINAGGKAVLLAHFDRPKGQRIPQMSLQQLLPALESESGRKVVFVADCIGAAAKAAIEAANPADIVLLENTRFHAGEEKNDPELIGQIAALGDVYCNDAFSAAHRAHASTEGLARALPACAGRLMEAELRALETALGAPKRPVAAVVGGAKVSTKLDLLSNLVEKVDHLIIGGGMANTFLAAQGHDIGKSLAEREMTQTANAILQKAASAGCNIILPTDIIVAKEFAEGADNTTYPASDCPQDGMILDAGPDTVTAIKACFDTAQTLIWNGPLGAFEIAPFDSATNSAALHAAARSSQNALISVAGGGDTVAALNKSGAASGFSYISTAGGAFLEWMEGKTLPGVAALNQ